MVDMVKNIIIQPLFAYNILYSHIWPCNTYVKSKIDPLSAPAPHLHVLGEDVDLEDRAVLLGLLAHPASLRAVPVLDSLVGSCASYGHIDLHMQTYGCRI